jgi:dihydroneopterin aldolase
VLADTVNYEAVYREVVAAVEAESHRLLEALARDILERVLGRFPVSEARVRLRKPNVPFAGSLASAEVEMVRTR